MKIGVIMDCLSQIKTYKDSTVAVLLEAQRRGHELFYIQMKDIFCENAKVFAHLQAIQLDESKNPWFSLGASSINTLNEVDLVLMRKDPPFDMEYLYATYLLELAEKQGAWILNNPNSIRNANEKLFTQWFPSLIPETLITSNKAKLQSFIDEQSDVVLKPLNEMGGRSIFHIKKDSDNRSVALDWLTQEEKRPIMAQRFIPEILKTGDKRITLIAGQPVPYALARMPMQGDFRGNLAAGGKGIGVPLTERDRQICAEVGPTLLERGLIWVGLDVIGDYLTEINVTSPTGLRELDHQFGINISAQLWDWAEENFKQKIFLK